MSLSEVIGEKEGTRSNAAHIVLVGGKGGGGGRGEK
jgi:hypothetical protein